MMYQLHDPPSRTDDGVVAIAGAGVGALSGEIPPGDWWPNGTEVCTHSGWSLENQDGKWILSFHEVEEGLEFHGFGATEDLPAIYFRLSGQGEP